MAYFDVYLWYMKYLFLKNGAIGGHSKYGHELLCLMILRLAMNVLTVLRPVLVCIKRAHNLHHIT